MSYRIFLTGSGVAPEVMGFLSDQGCVYETGEPGDSPADLERKLKLFNPHGLIVRQGQINEVVQAAAPDLRVISKHGVGTDNIGIQAATERGIVVTFTPGANTQAVAEHTLALILDLTRAVSAQDRLVRAGIFDKKNYVGSEISGKTLGLIGFGQIARRLVELVSPFNMEILVYHPSCSKELLPANVTKVQSPDAVLAQSDIVSLHAPLNESTKAMINKSSLARMKNTAFLVNTSRGALIDEADLVEALRNEQIAGAALDCFETEPLDKDNPLLQLKNIVITGHIAGISPDSLVNMGMIAAKNALAVLRKEAVEMHHVVNPSVLGTRG